MEFKKIRSVYQCELSTITPVHIGKGEKYLKNFDFLCENKQIRVFDRRKLFSIIEKGGEALINSFTIALDTDKVPEWFKHNKIKLNSLLLHSFSADRPPRDISIQIKDANNIPFIPGSSLKGALRTAILTKLDRSDDSHTVRRSVDKVLTNKFIKSNFADQEICKKLLGADAKINFMRSLTVGDFHFHEEQTEVRPVWITRLISPKKFKGKFPTYIEQIKTFLKAQGQITFDDYLGYEATEGAATDYFHFPLKLTLDWLLEAIREQTRKTIESEINFFTGKTGESIDQISQFYTSMLKKVKTLSKNEVILQLGWGSGWKSMTGQLLDEGKLNANARKKLKLAPNYTSYPFPKSRKISIADSRAVPMGWIKLTFTAKEEIKRQEKIRLKKEKEHRDAVEQEKNIRARWNALSEEEQDLAIVRGDEIARTNMPKADIYGDIWPKIESATPEHKKELANALKDRWQKEGRWNKKQCSKKQWIKIQKVKKIIEMK